MRFFISFLLPMVLVVPVQARTIADIEIPERIEIPGYDQPLVLNGAGIRKKLFIKVYVAGL